MTAPSTLGRTVTLLLLGLLIAGAGFFTLCSAAFSFAVPGLWLAVAIGGVVTWLLVRAFQSVRRGPEAEPAVPAETLEGPADASSGLPPPAPSSTDADRQP